MGAVPGRSTRSLGVKVTSPLELTVQRYLRELSPESRTRLLSTYAAEVQEFAHLSFRIVETLQLYHAQNKSHDPTEPKQAAFSLMTKGANGLMAGFELAIGGYRWEPAVVYRSVFEAFAVAWDIVHNPDRFALWRAGKNFGSTDSISRLKKEVEPAGQLYGYLSNMYVHTAPINSSPVMWKTGDELKFQFFGLVPEGRESVRKSEVMFSLLMGHVCLQLTELVFHNYATELETIEKIPGTDTVRTVVSQRHRPFVEASTAHFKDMAEGKGLDA
jgi:hypothetical protein